MSSFSPYSLQHLPDFKGIETNTSFHTASRLALAAPPWLQRDWDKSSLVLKLPCKLSCSTSLTSKGLRRRMYYFWVKSHTCSTSLTSKGLRRLEHFLTSVSLLAAPPWLQRDWDITTGYITGDLACSTSLTSKGLRLLLTEQFFARINLAAPPWLQRDWDVIVFSSLSKSVLQHPPDFKGIH